MARPLRIEYKGVFCHTTSRGNERRRICFAKSDYGRFKEKGRKYHCQFVLIQGLTPFFYLWQERKDIISRDKYGIPQLNRHRSLEGSSASGGKVQDSEKDMYFRE